jgi:hypothetical protein
MNELPPDRGLALAPILRRAGSVIESEIRGPSMGATLPNGTRIRISCRTEDSYQPGTVIAFVIPAGLVGHRVVALARGRSGRDLFFTRGDGAVVCDGPIEAGRVLGEVTEWFDGQSWHPVPAAPVMSAGRRVVAGLVLLVIRLSARVNIGAAARISGFLLRQAQRRRVPARSPGSQ